MFKLKLFVQPPIIRNAVLTAYAKVIIKCLNDKNLEPNHLKMRNKMLQALQVIIFYDFVFSFVISFFF